MRHAILVLLVVVGILARGGASQADLILDFNASSGVTDTGGGVDAWVAVVGGVTATPEGGNAVRRPVVQDGVFAGGQPGILFDGSNDIMVFDDDALPTGNAAFSIVAVFNSPTLNAFNQIVSWGTTSPANSATQASLGKGPPGAGDGTNNSFMFNNNGYIVRPGMEVFTNVSYVGIVTHATGTDTHTIYLIDKDGQRAASGEVGKSNAIDTSGDLGVGRIGNQYHSSNSDFYGFQHRGYIARLQVYDEELIGADLASVISAMNVYVDPPTLAPSSLVAAPDAVSLSFSTLAGANYRVETVDDLLGGTWQARGYRLTGNGSVMWVTDSDTSSGMQNYRVVKTP